MRKAVAVLVLAFGSPAIGQVDPEEFEKVCGRPVVPSCAYAPQFNGIESYRSDCLLELHNLFVELAKQVICAELRYKSSKEKVEAQGELFDCVLAKRTDCQIPPTLMRPDIID